jgi:DNA-binding response OmpR family regulator
MHEREQRYVAQTRTHTPLRTILAVSSDEAFRTEVCWILRRSGYHAVPARSGIEALWFSEHRAAHLLISDLLLPEIDGYHVGIPLLTLERQMPVIFTSSTPRSRCIAHGLLRKNSPFLHRPFPPRECLRIVERVLECWRPPLVA